MIWCIHRTTFLVACALVPAIVAQGADTKAPAIPAADWPAFNRDLAGTRYSPLTQINTRNVGALTRAWTLPLNVSATEVTPLVIGGVMYHPADKRVMAVDPETGKEIWRYDLPSGTPSRRGVSYWPGDQNNPAPRHFSTADHRADRLERPHRQNRSRLRQRRRGRHGDPVQLASHRLQESDLHRRECRRNSGAGSNLGNTRAFDVPHRSPIVGRFHSVAQPGEAGHESWEGDGWKLTATGVNNWGFQLTIDAERNIVYTNFGSPASDYYGADRKGNDLFGNSVVALDADTGKMKVVLPGGASRHLGFRPAAFAEPARYYGQGKENPGDRANGEGWLYVPAEPGDRRAGFRDSGNARSAEQGPRRTRLPR